MEFDSKNKDDNIKYKDTSSTEKSKNWKNQTVLAMPWFSRGAWEPGHHAVPGGSFFLISVG